MIAPAAAERFAALLETRPEAPAAALAAAVRAGLPAGTAPLPAGGGATLPACLADLKRCRQTFRALLRGGGFADPDREALDDVLVRSFDALELDLCARWSDAGAVADLVGRIRHLHALGAMARPLGHEINNLLQPVIGMAFSVRRKLPAESAEARNLGLIVDAGKQASAVVEELLGLARRSRSMRRPRHVAPSPCCATGRSPG